MTETDATKRPLEMPETFLPYLEKYRIYKLFKHDSYEPNCVSPAMMSEVTKVLTLIDPVPQAGWLMYDHPCTVREARCLQQDGVLPTVTLVLMPPPPMAPRAHNPYTPQRSFSQQDFEGLKIAYKATLKEVHVEPGDSLEQVGAKCVRAIRAAAEGAQGPGQGFHAQGAPGVYRVLIIGPSGSGRRTQAASAARHFDLVYLHFQDLFNEAQLRDDEVGEKLRKFGVSVQLKAEIVKRRIGKKDCIDHGWVLSGYPANGVDFEQLDRMPTPPNRIIFLNVPWAVCKERALANGVDWCTGREAPVGSGPRVLPRRPAFEAQLDAEVRRLFVILDLTIFTHEHT
ncbi:jg15693 [Pararge aegeria aegeria]|uniref:Jg15693 protein n=1 Tax=Pararge aegeria aegeria TaxID=348720 RepID=A0A8S4SEN6_9NEOP|nr:jg15693 [Pararge aegeria aegeria]